LSQKEKSMALKYPGANIRGLSARLAVCVFALSVLPFGPAAVVRAQETPRTVKLIVNYPAGAGTADVIARIMSEWLARKWLQPVIVENIPGATGSVGAEAVFRAPPDGSTLLVTPPGALTVAQHLQTLSFDPRQFVPVTLLATTPIVLVARPDFPASNLRELIDYARRHPAALKAANQGVGSTAYLTAEWLRVAAALAIVHVPFRGSVAALQGLADGRVDIMFDNLGSSSAPIASRQVKVLAVASRMREPSLPDVPTVAEQLPDFVSATWVAVVAPPQTPRQIADRLNADLREGLARPDIATLFRENGCEPAGMTLEATATFVQAETDKWAKVVKTKGFRLD
jgi:tripartite-type tricarboxylate transporter receptor subunit TctC